MKLLIIPVVAVMFGSLTVHSLQCYECSSSMSMDDCSSQQIKSTCPGNPSSDYCGKVEVKDESGENIFFTKGCFSEEFCDGGVAPCNQPGVLCKADCCFSDLCNGIHAAVEPLSCYHCSGADMSMDDCVKHQQSKQCPAGWNRCGVMHSYSGEKTSVYKGCFAEQSCLKFCADPEEVVAGWKCELSCCENNDCN